MSNQIENPFSLRDRVVLITGASRGIGRALAEACGQAGAHVVVNGRSTDSVEAATTELRDAGYQASPGVGDVTDAEQVAALVDSIESEIGPIAGLINNAGIQRRAPFLEFPLSEYRELMETNLVAPFMVGQAVGARMAERGAGRIINVGSVNSQIARKTIAGYSATKGGISLLTRGMCADLAPLGIQVNCIAPGYFDTELTEVLVNDPEFTAWLAGRTPAGRWGDVSELGGAAVFLLSDAASFINGQTIFIDGGMTAIV